MNSYVSEKNRYKKRCMTLSITPLKWISLFAVSVAILAACSSGTTIRPGDSVDVAFEKAMELYENERYNRSAEAFETVLSIGRGTEYARDAQYYLAMSYYNNNQFMLAASEFQRYASTNPRSDRREESQYMEAMSYYELSPRYQLDQSDTRRAVERFQLFINRNPNSELVEDAREKIEEMRKKLAKKKFHAGMLYLDSLREFEAAAIYFEQTIDEYPDTKWAERALVQQMRAYIKFAENSVEERQEERFNKAIDSYERYLQIFPEGENRDRAERLYERAQDGLSDVEGLATS